jgi:hypothetical protein
MLEVGELDCKFRVVFRSVPILSDNPHARPCYFFQSVLITDTNITKRDSTMPELSNSLHYEPICKVPPPLEKAYSGQMILFLLVV